jgi:hypothetical protein
MSDKTLGEDTRIPAYGRTSAAEVQQSPSKQVAVVSRRGCRNTTPGATGSRGGLASLRASEEPAK